MEVDIYRNTKVMVTSISFTLVSKKYC